MKALLFAYSEIGVVGLETLVELGVEVAGVVTHADNPWEEKWFRSVAETAQSRKFPVQIFADPNTPEAIAWGQALKPDVIFSFYYRQMLKTPWLELAPLGAFNLHGSLLPKFRGRACVNWAIIEGATETGVTLHDMVKLADAGDILGQERITIEANDTARQVFDKLVPAARTLLKRVVPQIQAGTAKRLKQDESQATTFGGRKAKDGEIDWGWPAQRIHNWVRALTRPYPGAFAFFDGQKVQVWKGAAISEKASGVPGQVLAPLQEGIPVVTGDGLYVVQETSPKDFLLQRAAEGVSQSH